MRLVWCALVLSAAACASRPGYQAPSSERDYAVLVLDEAPLSEHLVRELRRHGVRVSRQVRGGRGPTAVLITREVRPLEPPGVALVHAWLHDTRTGRLLATASVPADSVAAAPRDAARALAESLVVRLRSDGP